jgi:hypothetical protein
MGRFTRAVAVVMMATSCANGGQPADPTGQPPSTPPGWQTHSDTSYGFAIDYPPEYVVLPERPASGESRPPALRNVRFQHRDIAAGQFADREPARFTIEVFERNGRTTLRGWLEEVGRLPQAAVVSPVRLQGAREGLRVQMRQQLAPNEFVYFATAAHVYALTPVGEHGDQMLASFRLEP